MNYDRQVENSNTSTFHKMKETYWTTKQAVMQKLGKKEDQHIVASDHELDTKLDVSWWMSYVILNHGGIKEFWLRM